MTETIIPAIIFLSLVWFFIYWIFGGVFFAVMTLMGMRRIRQVRFSCLYTISALLIAPITAYVGINYSESSITECLANSETKAEAVMAIFGCGFAAVLGTFLIGAGVIISLGFVFMTISRAKSEAWIRIDQKDSTTSGVEKNKFFDSRRETKNGLDSHEIT